ncbi:MAG: hypothetical protein QXH00_10115 [Candidatus Jordarchaeales archaeon]
MAIKIAIAPLKQNVKITSLLSVMGITKTRHKKKNIVSYGGVMLKAMEWAKDTRKDHNVME